MQLLLVHNIWDVYLSFSPSQFVEMHRDFICAMPIYDTRGTFKNDRISPLFSLLIVVIEISNTNFVCPMLVYGNVEACR